MVGEARAAGATIGGGPGTTFWGGYAGVFIDPNGHPWEVAHNPGWTSTTKAGYRSGPSSGGDGLAQRAGQRRAPRLGRVGHGQVEEARHHDAVAPRLADDPGRDTRGPRPGPAPRRACVGARAPPGTSDSENSSA